MTEIKSLVPTSVRDTSVQAVRFAFATSARKHFLPLAFLLPARPLLLPGSLDRSQLLGAASTTAIQTPAMAPSALCLPSAPLDPFPLLSDCVLLGLPPKANLGHSQDCCSHFQESSQEFFFSLGTPLGAAVASFLAETSCSPRVVANVREDSPSPDQSSNGDFEHPCQEVSSSWPATSSGHDSQADDANLLLHFTDQVNPQFVPVPASN